MRLILGGRNMGKRAYADRLYDDLKFCDLAELEAHNIFNFNNNFNAIINLHMGVKNLMLKGYTIEELFSDELIELMAFKYKVIIGDEIGGGVVPVDKFERHWRDETGLLYQRFAVKAEIVERVWAGLPMRLK